LLGRIKQDALFVIQVNELFSSFFINLISDTDNDFLNSILAMRWKTKERTRKHSFVRIVRSDEKIEIEFINIRKVLNTRKGAL